jgi:hypothetical protein
MSDIVGQAPGLDTPCSVISSAARKELQGMAKGSICEAVRKLSTDSQIGGIGASVSSALTSSDAFESVRDAASRLVPLNALDTPRFDSSAYALPNYSIPDLSEYVEGFRTNWHQLIIIGNGFDLQCGLRSEFGDFFKPRFDAIGKISDCTRDTWQSAIEDNGLTLWDFILEGNVDSPWCDVEGTIERWVLSANQTAYESPSNFNRAVESLKSCPFSDRVVASGRSEDNRYNESRLYGNVARYVWTMHPEMGNDGCNHAMLIAYLRQELHKLEHAFATYLANEVRTNEEYAKKCKELYHAIERDGKKAGDDYSSSTSVLSFNYTDLVGHYFDGGDDGAFVNIHGKLGGEIIFGIDGKDCMDNPDAVSFTKTFRLMQRGGSRTDKLIWTANSANLQGATDVIKFYGHSLGRADYSYFQSIFDGVDLYESKTVLVFYYPYDSFDENKNEEWRNDLANSINDLLVGYGTTMDNGDHGKNLMHKLLLEGRLILRGVQVD